MGCTAVVRTRPTVLLYPPTLDLAPVDWDQLMDLAEVVYTVPVVPLTVPVVPHTVPVVLTVLVVHMDPSVHMDLVD